MTKIICLKIIFPNDKKIERILISFNCFSEYIRHAHGDLCKHLVIDSSTDLDDRYSNLFQNAYINCHAHTEYLKII